MMWWWLYAGAIAFLVATAGWVLERVAWSYGRPSRGVWAGGILVASTIPAAMFVAGRMGVRLRLLDRLMAWVEPQAPTTQWVATVVAASSLQATFLPVVWLVSSLIAVGVAVTGEVRWRLRIGRTSEWRVCAVPVLLSGSRGPAVLGIARPRVLLPLWLTSANRRRQRLAVVHELSHIRHGDVPVLWCCYLVGCCMPWNPALWWMLHRLQRAVEIDCDRRVVAGGVDRREYGELLVHAASVRSLHSSLAVGLTRRRSLVRDRVMHIASPVSELRHPKTVLVACLATLLVASALLPEPPASAPARGGTVTRVDPREAPGASAVFRARELQEVNVTGVPAGTLSPRRILTDAELGTSTITPVPGPPGEESAGSYIFKPSGTVRPSPRR